MAPSTTLLVATVKNEGPHILEWVAHHRLCGFDTIMVFQNGSDDFTTQTLRTLDALGAIEFHQNPVRFGSPQKGAYIRASASEAFQAHDYCIALDGDEFLTVHAGTGSIHDLLSATQHPDIVRLNWRNFGSAGHIKLTQELVTERFALSTPKASLKNSLTGYKTLFRTSCFERIGIHQPRFPKRDVATECNGSGLKPDEYRLLNWRSTDPGCSALAQINHYPIRDAAAFLIKAARGSAHQMHRSVDLAYWKRFDLNDEEDRSLADRSERIWAEMERLDSLSDGRLLTLRKRAFRNWRKRFLSLLKNEEYRALYDAMVTGSDMEAEIAKGPA